jgi:hypothetical protein
MQLGNCFTCFTCVTLEPVLPRQGRCEPIVARQGRLRSNRQRMRTTRRTGVLSAVVLTANPPDSRPELAPARARFILGSRHALTSQYQASRPCLPHWPGTGALPWATTAHALCCILNDINGLAVHSMSDNLKLSDITRWVPLPRPASIGSRGCGPRWRKSRGPRLSRGSNAKGDPFSADRLCGTPSPAGWDPFSAGPFSPGLFPLRVPSVTGPI